MNEARFDDLGALARFRIVGSRLGEDGRRPAAEQARVGGLVRGEDQGVGRDRRAGIPPGRISKNPINQSLGWVSRRFGEMCETRSKRGLAHAALLIWTQGEVLRYANSLPVWARGESTSCSRRSCSSFVASGSSLCRWGKGMSAQRTWFVSLKLIAR